MKIGMKIYAIVAMLTIVVIAAFLLNLSYIPQEKMKKLPSDGGYSNLSLPITHWPGKVEIIEFFKFDWCPSCYDLNNDLPKLLEKYDNNVNITYVPVVWPNQSTKIIEAYIIADKMGKGKEMRDALFNEARIEMSNETVVANFKNGIETKLKMMDNVSTLENIAANIGLGSDFNSQLEGDYAIDAANANLELMNKYSVVGAPTILINIQVDPPTTTNLNKAIDSILKLSFPTTYEIFEFLSFDCISCYDLQKNLPQILEKYDNNLPKVWITYKPIVRPGQSTKSIEAYIIADKYGKGKEMLDALFDAYWVKKMNIIESIPALENVAESIGLRGKLPFGTDFKSELERDYARDAANANIELMNKYGVVNIPTFIININVIPPTAKNLDNVIDTLIDTGN